MVHTESVKEELATMKHRNNLKEKSESLLKQLEDPEPVQRLLKEQLFPDLILVL